MSEQFGSFVRSLESKEIKIIDENHSFGSISLLLPALKFREDIIRDILLLSGRIFHTYWRH